MESNQEHNMDKLHRKAIRAKRLAIISCFLLALFWSLDAFFAWVFLGLAVYFRFLSAYYDYQATPKEPDPEYRPKQPYPSPAHEGSKRPIRVIRLLPVILSLVIFAIIARMITSGTDSAEATSNREIQEEDSTKSLIGENNSNDLDVLTNRGNEFYNNGKYDSALFYYNRVLTIDPSNQFAQYDKALVYYAQKDYGRSVPILLRCVRQHPGYGEALWLLGDNYYDRHHLDSAKICFDLAYEKGIRNGGLLQLMASLYETDNRPKAIALYKESIEQDSTLVDSYRKLAELDPSQKNSYQRMMTKWTK
jgi:tetratricopeptide (TPR) repeat protein